MLQPCLDKQKCKEILDLAAVLPVNNHKCWNFRVSKKNCLRAHKHLACIQKGRKEKVECIYCCMVYKTTTVASLHVCWFYLSNLYFPFYYLTNKSGLEVILHKAKKSRMQRPVSSPAGKLSLQLFLIFSRCYKLSSIFLPTLPRPVKGSTPNSTSFSFKTASLRH